MKIIVFGTGSSADSFLRAFDPACGEIVFFVDNNKEKQSAMYHQYTIEPPEKITGTEFDFIVIASQFSHEIGSQLAAMGVPVEKIVPFHYEVHTAAAHKRYKEIIGNMTRKSKMITYRKTRIAITHFNYSNSNGYALYQAMPESISDKYDVSLISEDRKEELHNYDVIVSSSYDGIYNGKHLNIELWHGFPIKRMGMMDERRVTSRYISFQERRAKHVHLIASCSPLFTTFFNACFPTDIHKYKITGFPRNDLLFQEGSIEKLEKMMKKKLRNNNVVFYMPTWRKFKFHNWVDVDRDWNRLFHFPNEDERAIANMLEQLDVTLVVKLHPYEYHEYKDLSIFHHERVFLLTDEMLEKEHIHLYEVLGAAKIMLTDYSSVFFDTLLIDLPVIFAPTDQQKYRENRGFLLEPYQSLTPGPTVHDLDELKSEIKLYLEGNDRYREARAMVRDLVFKYTDGQSGRRVWEMIDDFLSDEANHLLVEEYR